jgi:Raf kinase inhibitor-like YbhB/YbcL family protein
MSKRLSVLVFGLLLAPGLDPAIGHDGPGTGQGTERTWTHASGRLRFEGSFVALRGDQVRVRRHDGEELDLRLDALAVDDRRWVRDRQDAIARLNTEPKGMLLALNAPEPAESRFAPDIADAFKAFADKVKTRRDRDFFYVESDGMPEHRMMVGITAWQRQVPLPQPYTGANAWRVPLHPVPAKNPLSTNGRFLRGAIALAPNGVPIFNPLNNRGEDSYAIGELDEFGGHCGRADDYHYHVAPVHLEKAIGPGLPIAYALDGYPIFGYDEPDGSKRKRLDAFNGHEAAGQPYHYHASKTYPYLNGGFHGEVVEAGGQVDPQPRAEPIREAQQPLRGAKITDFRTPKPGVYSLTYEVRGRKGQIDYTIQKDGSVAFTETDPSGQVRAATYARRGRGPGGGGDRAANRPADEPPPPPPPGGRRPPENPLFLAVDTDRDGRLSPAEIARAPQALLALDRDGNGRLSEEEVRPSPPNDAPQQGGRGPAAEPPLEDFGTLKVSSPAFEDNGKFPVDFTCDGAGVSPPIEWKDAPKGTKSFALSLWHVPGPGSLKSYWVVSDIPAKVAALPRNVKGVGKVGLNDKHHAGYDPMCSQGPGAKTYHITVYALSKELNLDPSKATRDELLKAMGEARLAQKTLTYRYERGGQN